MQYLDMILGGLGSGWNETRALSIELFLSVPLIARFAIAIVASGVAVFVTVKSRQVGIIANVMSFLIVFALTAVAGIIVAWFVMQAMDPNSWLRHPMPSDGDAIRQ